MTATLPQSSEKVIALKVGCYGLAGVSTGMSGYFGWSLGDTAPASLVFLIAAVAADILKVGASVAFGRLAARRSSLAAVALALVVSTATLSVIGCIGFMAGQRATASGESGAADEKAARLRDEAVRLETEKAALGTDLPSAATAIAQIEIMRLDARWKSSSHCTDATADRSIQFCASLFAADATAQNAARAVVIHQRLNEIRAELAALPKTRGPRAQNEAIAKIIGASADDVGRWITVVIIFVTELAATVGVALSNAQDKPAPAQTALASAAPVPAPVARPIGEPEDEVAAPALPVALQPELAGTFSALNRIARDGRIWLGQRDMAKLMEMKPSTVNRHLIRLADLGAVTSKRVGGKTEIRIATSPSQNNGSTRRRPVLAVRDASDTH